MAREAAVVAAALGVLYLVTMTSSHHEAEDSLAYAANIRGGAARDVLNQNHLAWGALGWLVYNGARGLGLATSPLAPLQVMNAVLGAFGVALLWWFIRGIGFTRVAAGATCGLLGLSYGYWYYSGEAEVYILSTVALIVCVVLTYRAATGPRPRAFALLGLANGAAVLAHNTNVLFVAVAATALALVRPGIGNRVAVRCAAAYAAAASAVVAAGYVAAAAAIGFRSISQFYDWLTAYPTHGQWGHLAFSDLPKGAVGAGRALVGADFVFAFRPGSVVNSIAQGDAGAQRYLMRDFPEAEAVVLCALAAAVGVALVASLLPRPRRGVRVGGDPQRVLDRLALAWFLPYTLFFLWWEPLNLEFWIAWLVPVALVIGPRLAGLGERGGRWRVTVPAVVGCLALVNLVGSVLPQDSSRDDYWRVRTQWYEQHARPSDKIVASGYVFSNYLRYFTPARVLDVQDLLAAHPAKPGPAVGVMLGVLMKTPGARTLASDQVFYPDRDRYSSCQHSDDCAVAALIRPYLLQYARVLAQRPLETVWDVARLPRIVLPKLPGRDLTHVPHR